MYMKNLPADLVNKVLIDINEEYKKKIKELEDDIKIAHSQVECLQCELDESVEFIISHGGICCEQCDIWGMNGQVIWCQDRQEHLCEECRS